MDCKSHRLNSHALLLILTITAGFACPCVTWAQSPNEAETQRAIEHLRLQITEIQRESQMKFEALQRQTEEQLQQLGAQIAQLEVATAHSQSLAAEQPPTAPQRPNAEPAVFREKLDFSGDFRLRYEYNTSYADVPSWDRGVMRGRLAAGYALNDNFKIGARLVTGNPDDPRTADFTVGDFAGDFEVSLDQAYASYESNGLYVTGGKFAKPFSSTELVWDGDVNPQGFGGYYDMYRNDTWSARLSGTYFIIDQSIFEDGSDMAGSQLSLDFRPDSDWQLGLHAAYFDYAIGALDPDVPGGARGNNVAADGRYYLSDFKLLNMISTVTYKGFGDQWDVRFVGDFVKNLGAEVPEDSGYGFDLMAGNLQQPGRFLFRYGYAHVETDAVLGMFSNDNLIYPTNYELHTFSVDYALQEHTFLGLTSYVYRRLEYDSNAEMYPNDWLSRTRLNLYFTF